MSKSILARLCILALLALPLGAQATVLTFVSSLSGSQETPPNSSPAIGGAVLTFDTASGLFDLFLSGQSLTFTLVGAQIGIGAPGAPGTDVYDLDPDQFFFSRTGFARVISDAVFPVASVPGLLANNAFINIETGFGHPPGGPYLNGEIRGQLTQVIAAQPVPEAETWVLMAAGLGLLMLAGRRARRH